MKETPVGEAIEHIRQGDFMGVDSRTGHIFTAHPPSQRSYEPHILPVGYAPQDIQTGQKIALDSNGKPKVLNDKRP